MTMVRLISFSLAGMLLVACGADAQPPRNAVDEGNEARPEPAASGPENQNCAVTANDKCFSSLAEACAALGCPTSHCQAAYSYPAQATCH